MARIPRPTQKSVPLGGQIPLGSAAAPARAGAQIGQVLQNAGAARAGDAQALIRQGNQYFKLIKPAADNTDFAINLSKATVQYQQQLQERLGQVTDENGNPTYGTLQRDAKNIAESVMNSQIEGLGSPEAKSKFRAQFTNYTSNQQIAVMKTARDQNLSFMREGLSRSITEMGSQAGGGSEADMLFFEGQTKEILDEAVQSGAITPEDRFTMQESFRKEVSLARTRNEVDADPEAALERIKATPAEALGLREHERQTIQGEAQRAANKVATARASLVKEEERLIKTQLNNIQEIIDLGGAPPPELMDEVSAKVQGTKFESAYAGLMQRQTVMSEFNFMSPIARNQLTRGLKSMRGELSADSIKFADKLESIDRELQTKMDDDLFGLAMEQGVVADVSPFDVNGDIGAQLGARMSSMSMIEQQYGKTAMPLTKEEVDAFQEKYRTGTYQERSSMLGEVLKGMGSKSQFFLAELAKKGSTQMAFVGNLLREGRAPTAVTILKGQDVLKDQGDIIPSDYKEAAMNVLSDLMPQYAVPGQRKDVEDAVKAIYAARAFESNEFEDITNEDRIESAIKEVTNGGAIEYNDSIVEPPVYGMDDDDFEDWVGNVSDEDINRLGGWKGFEGNLSEKLQDAELVSIGRGRYVARLLAGDGTFRPVLQEDGEVFVLDYDRLNDKVVDRAPAQPQAEAQEQVESMTQTLESFGMFDGREQADVQSPAISPNVRVPQGKEQVANDIISSIKESGVSSDVVSNDTMLRIARIESNFEDKAVSPTGAIGLFQFTKRTWDDMVGKFGSQFGIKGDMRNDPRANTIMATKLAEVNAASIEQKLGRPAKPVDIYMAHNIGVQGTIRLLAANPSRRVSRKLLGSKPESNPKFFKQGSDNVTVGEALRRYRKDFEGIK